MADRSPSLTREQHLAALASKYPFAELVALGFDRCVLADRFKKRQSHGPWIRVATFSDVWERALTLDVDKHGVVHGHITTDVGDDQLIFIAETVSAAIQLVAVAPGTPTDQLLRIPNVSARAL